ncbi:MAG: hypothetical protein ABI360_02525 [Allobranchiibius sp.]
MRKDDGSVEEEFGEDELDEDSVDIEAEDEVDLKADDAAETQQQAADGDVDDAVRRTIGPWLLVPIALAMVLLCLQHWSTQTFVLSGAAANSTKHIYVNGFGAVSTDIAGADASNGNGPSLGGWMVLGCAVVLLLAGVLRGLGKMSRPAPVAALVAAVVQIASVIYSALVVNAQSGDFYSKMVDNARAIGLQVTFSVGWGLWLELLFGFAALAVAIGVLVRERNVDILLVRT